MQNDIMKAVLSSNPSVAVLASEEDDEAIRYHASSSSGSSSSSSGGGYAVVFDPLDGSRNIDAAIPTGAGCMKPQGLHSPGSEKAKGSACSKSQTATSCLTKYLLMDSHASCGHVCRVTMQCWHHPCADIHCTAGTIFGVYKVAAASDPQAAVLQPGSQLVASGYALYSSATMLVISVGQVNTY
jgi:fructose-1,6-bisphosphatase I